jgi:hypothetical protein
MFNDMKEKSFETPLVMKITFELNSMKNGNVEVSSVGNLYENAIAHVNIQTLPFVNNVNQISESVRNIADIEYYKKYIDNKKYHISTLLNDMTTLICTFNSFGMEEPKSYIRSRTSNKQIFSSMHMTVQYE